MNQPPSEKQSGCPERDILLAFHSGRLSEPNLEVIAEHLDTCTTCSTVLRELNTPGATTASSDRLRRWLDWPSLLAEAGWERLRAAAEAIAVSSDDEQRTADPEPASSEGHWVGRTIGRHVLLARIGQGGMGAVYRARQEPIGREVALKMVLAGAHAGEQVRERFTVEGKAAGRLRHPNVVQIHEFGEHEGMPYYTMELIEGESLATRLRRGPLPPREAATLVRTLAQAMAFAHVREVLHRDLKPGNVLMGTDGIPRITDFGLAKLLDVEGEGPTLTSALLGTPAYMAPEQAEGRAREVGPEADVYGLGAILYHCLTGQPPFRGETPVKTLDLVRTTEPVPPSRRRPGVPSGLEAICLKCLEKRPAARYVSAQALADDLQRWLEGGRPAGTPGWRRWAWKTVRRRSSLASLAVVLVGVVAAAYLAVPAPSPGPPTVTPEQVLQSLQVRLAAGQPATLIGPAGEPAWMRWVSGGTRGKTSLNRDGELVVDSWPLGLLELLPELPRTGVRFTAEVRHMNGDPGGRVGVYFARQAHPSQVGDVHALGELVFNDVRTHLPNPALIPRGVIVKPENLVYLLWRLYSDEENRPSISASFQFTGPTGFPPAGEGRTGWRLLQVELTEDQVTCRWEGIPVVAPIAETNRWFAQQAARVSKLAHHREDPSLRRWQPRYYPRGGLGLSVRSGSAAFRNVSVTPIVK